VWLRKKIYIFQTEEEKDVKFPFFIVGFFFSFIVCWILLLLFGKYDSGRIVNSMLYTIHYTWVFIIIGIIFELIRRFKGLT